MADETEEQPEDSIPWPNKLAASRCGPSSCHSIDKLKLDPNLDTTQDIDVATPYKSAASDNASEVWQRTECFEATPLVGFEFDEDILTATAPSCVLRRVARPRPNEWEKAASRWRPMSGKVRIYPECAVPARAAVTAFPSRPDKLLTKTAPPGTFYQEPLLWQLQRLELSGSQYSFPSLQALRLCESSPSLVPPVGPDKAAGIQATLWSSRELPPLPGCIDREPCWIPRDGGSGLGDASWRPRNKSPIQAHSLAPGLPRSRRCNSGFNGRFRTVGNKVMDMLSRRRRARSGSSQ